LADGQVWDWGYGAQGQLGDGKFSASDVPVEVPLPSPASEMYMGGSAADNGQTLVLLQNGQVWGWGSNTSGQLADGNQKYSAVPVQATALPKGESFTAVAAGGGFSMALGTDGDVWAWGDNSDGQVGTGTASVSVLTPVKVLSGADMISATAADAVAHVPAK